MFAVGLALMLFGVVLFGVGFGWPAASRARARANTATILCCYVGLVLTLSAKLRG